MKNAEGGAHPFELLDRRLRESTDQLRDVTKVLEALGRSAGALQRMVNGVQSQQAARTADRTSKTQSAPPPARGAQASHGSVSQASATKDDIPEWRKVFPDLSNKVPSRGR